MGRLTRNPDVRYTEQNNSQEKICIARYSLAVDRRVKNEGQPLILIDIGKESDMDADMVKACEECEKDAANQAWTTVEEELPPPDKYLLLSLENYPIPMVGRYLVNGDEDGTFMIGSSQESFLQNDLYVNAWMELPVPYDTGNDLERYRAAITKDFMKNARR